MKAWEFCEQNSSSIEVVYRDDEQKEGVLTRVHFNINIEVSYYLEHCAVLLCIFYCTIWSVLDSFALTIIFWSLRSWLLPLRFLSSPLLTESNQGRTERCCQIQGRQKHTLREAKRFSWMDGCSKEGHFASCTFEMLFSDIFGWFFFTGMVEKEAFYFCEAIQVYSHTLLLNF